MATNGLNLQTSGLTFTTGEVVRSIITDTGLYGLGVTAPEAMLHVVPTGETTSVRFEGLGASSTETNFLVADSNGVVSTRSDIAVGTVITAVTESNNVITVEDNQGASSNLTIDAITGVSYDSSWGITNAGTGTVSASFELPFITAASLSNGSLSFTVNGGLETISNVAGFSVNVAGDDDSSSVNLGGTITVAGGTGITTAQNAGTITVNMDNTSITLAGDSGSQTVELGDTLTVAGGTGLSSVVSATDTVTINLDNTAVTPAEYGSASETVTFTVDQQGRLTAASEQSISITASQVSDFDTEVLSSVFEAANFVDSTEIDFTVTEGASVTAAVKSSSITNAMLANDSITLGADSGSGSVDLGETLTISGDTGISVSVSGAQYLVDLDDTAVTPNTYGSSSSVGTFTVDQQGRLTAASDVTIDGSAINNNNAFTTISVPTGANPVADAYNDTLTFISSDNSISISGNSGSDTIDITVSDANIDNIYTADGTLSGARTVTQAGNKLSFTGGDFSVDGTTFNVDDSGNSVGVGTATPAASAVLEVVSTTKGFLFPRMTESQRTSIGSPATGLMVYQTDGSEGIYIYKSFGWVQVI